MRFDDLGLFWEDHPEVKETKGAKTKTAVKRAIAPVPDTGWVAPSEFPNLFGAKILGFDIETYDPELKTHGAGWARGSGHVIGVSVATADRGWYFPFRHEMHPEQNLNKENVYRYLRDLLGEDSIKVGANLLYDVGWLQHEGVPVNGKLYDVSYAEALLYDTAKSYSLEAIAQRHLGTGKVSSVVYDWCSRSYGGGADQKQRANLYRTPPSLVGPYAEADATEPLAIINKQFKLLKDAGMWELFEK